MERMQAQVCAAHDPGGLTSPAGASRRAAVVAVVATACLWLGMRVVFFEGFWGVDDFHHARHAWLWDRPPANHWESRLPHNALMRASFLVLGYGQVQAAIPSLLGSAILFASCLAMAQLVAPGTGALWPAGLLAATLPNDVIFGTNPCSRTLAAALVTLGTVVLLARPGARGRAGAGLLCALGIWTHLAAIFPAAIAVAVAAVLDRGRRRTALLAGVVMLAGWAAMDMGANAAWGGEPLRTVRIARESHLAGVDAYFDARPPLDATGRFRIGFLVKPARDLLFSKDFGLLLPAACLAGAFTWRRLNRPGRIVLAAGAAGWLYLSYGSQTPTSYQPLPGTANYWQSLALPAVTALAVLGARRPRLGLPVAAALAGVNVLLLSMGGAWGMGVENSRELLAYVRAHPEMRFIADDRTLEDMSMLSGIRPPANVLAAPVSPGTRFCPSVRHEDGPDGREVYVLVNPLRDREEDPASVRWIAANAGEPVHRGSTGYRMATLLLPEAWRRHRVWTHRRPAPWVARLLVQPGE